MTALSVSEEKDRFQNASDIPGVNHDEAGDAYRFGSGRQAHATIEIDPSTFNRLASGRLSAEAVLAQVAIEGDQAIAAWFMNQADIPY